MRIPISDDRLRRGHGYHHPDQDPEPDDEQLEYSWENLLPDPTSIENLLNLRHHDPTLPHYPKRRRKGSRWLNIPWTPK